MIMLMNEYDYDDAYTEAADADAALLMLMMIVTKWRM